MDHRKESFRLKDKSSKGGSRSLVVSPDVIADFKSIPFRDERFHLVVFDPPHMTKNGKTGWLHKKYGTLPKEWKPEIAAGFKECFRVLKPKGILVFKWNEHQIPVSKVIELSPIKPLFGNRTGRQSKSHWLVFMKDTP